MKGSYTVQCKHTSVSGTTLSVGDLTDELEKAERLAGKELADNYLLLTNCAVTGTAAENIRAAFTAIPGIKWFGLYGSTWINTRIRETPRLRMLVPRVYGLGDLSQILDERAYEQARVILDSLGPELRKFVTTGAHNKAANAILSHGFVILLGEPASGKSMIAATLALGAIDVWNCHAMKLTEPIDFKTHWNPHEPRQFLWFDDAFGATQYQRDLVLSWNRIFPHMAAAIHAGTRIIFTSRDYIFKAAMSDIKTSAFPLLKESQVVVNVRELLPDETRQMVYNHIKMGDQTAAFKSRIKPLLEQVSQSKRFLPEIARRLGTQLFTRNLQCDSDHVRSFVEQPVEYLTDVLSSLDAHSKAAIGLLFMNGGNIAHPMTLAPRETHALTFLGSSEQEVRRALPLLDGDILRLVRSEPSQWTYKHPTIGDAYARLLAQDPELVDVYLGGVAPDKLLREITCGDTGLTNAVIIPHSRYAAILDALDRLGDDDALYMFLTYRCDSSFLEQYLSRHPTFIESLFPFGSFMGAVREVSVIARLDELGLLPNWARLRFIARAAILAVETPDSDWIGHDRIRRIFTDDEVQKLLAVVRTSLVPRIDDAIRDWRSNYSRNDEPDSYFEPLKDALSTYKTHLADEESESVISAALDSIDTEIEELTRDREDPYDEDEDYHSSSSSSDSDEYRSVFEDVDE